MASKQYPDALIRRKGKGSVKDIRMERLCAATYRAIVCTVTWTVFFSVCYAVRVLPAI